MASPFPVSILRNLPRPNLTYDCGVHMDENHDGYERIGGDDDNIIAYDFVVNDHYEGGMIAVNCSQLRQPKCWG